MSEDKNQAPTPRRLQKAREEGQVAVSRELSMFASLSAGSLALAAQGSGAGIAPWLAASLRQNSYSGAQMWAQSVHALLLGILPAACAALAGYAAATLLQSGMLLHVAALQPDLTRLSPLAGLKRLFGPQAAVQLARALAKLAVLGLGLTLVMRALLPILPATSFTAPSGVLTLLLAHGRQMVLLLLGGQAIIAAADVAWERVRHTRRLRMSFQEVRDEHKESEGNPQIRQRLRQLARSRAGRRMMQAVPKAAVVITNPTHYAVALTYERGGQGAPRIVAKGADDVAAKIRELAQAHRVPIVANPPLARALYRIEIDTEIPAEHFRAVAEIIAYVWRMRTQALRR